VIISVDIMIDTIGLIILLTVLAHIIEDFHLQGIMASMKQKSWWFEQFAKVSAEQPDREMPDIMRKYGKDYIIVLILHGMEWSICVSLPALILGDISLPLAATLAVVVIMGLIHALIDDLKANRLVINLWADQLLHMIQLILLLSVLLW